MTDASEAAEPHGSAPHLKDTGFASTTSTVFGRDTAYFDAVYGFAATLLISNVDAPPAEAWQSVEALLESGAATQALGFVLSFTAIAFYWRANVRLTRRLKGLDSVTTTLNLVAAASVIFIAFTTQGVSDPRSAGLPLPVALYALNLALASLILTLTYQVARARGLERHRTPRRRYAAETAGALILPVVLLASIPVAYTVGVDAAKYMWLSLVIIVPIARTLAARVS